MCGRGRPVPCGPAPSSAWSPIGHRTSVGKRGGLALGWELCGRFHARVSMCWTTARWMLRPRPSRSSGTADCCRHAKLTLTRSGTPSTKRWWRVSVCRKRTCRSQPTRACSGARNLRCMTTTGGPLPCSMPSGGQGRRVAPLWTPVFIHTVRPIDGTGFIMCPWFPSRHESPPVRQDRMPEGVPAGPPAALHGVLLAPRGRVRSEHREPSKAELEIRRRLDRKG